MEKPSLPILLLSAFFASNICIKIFPLIGGATDTATLFLVPSILSWIYVVLLLVAALSLLLQKRYTVWLLTIAYTISDIGTIYASFTSKSRTSLSTQTLLLGILVLVTIQVCVVFYVRFLLKTHTNAINGVQNTEGAKEIIQDTEHYSARNRWSIVPVQLILFLILLGFALPAAFAGITAETHLRIFVTLFFLLAVFLPISVIGHFVCSIGLKTKNKEVARKYFTYVPILLAVSMVTYFVYLLNEIKPS